MSHNTATNPGQNGDTIYTVDVTLGTFPTTGKVAGAALLASANITTAPAPITTANPLFVRASDGTNLAPTMDAAARAGFVKVTNGTQTLPSGDAVGRSIFVAPGDATNVFLSGAAANVAAATAINSQLVTAPGNWPVTAQATAGTPSGSKAAGGAGVRHVASGISISVSTGATAQTPVIVNLRDGATGAGTIIRTWALSAPANSTVEIDESGLNLVGTANTAMTLEFAGATVAASIASVNLNGFDVS